MPHQHPRANLKALPRQAVRGGSGPGVTPNMEVRMTKQEVLTILKQDYNLLTAKGYEVFGVFLFGSQNYGLDRETSDIDVKVIYTKAPDEQYKVFFRHEPSGQITPLSIDSFLSSLENGYHTWCELLFTDFYYVPYKFCRIWNRVLLERDKYICENKKVIIDREVEYINSQIDYLKKHDIKNVSQANKRLSYLYRSLFMIDSLLNNLTYAEALRPTEDIYDIIMDLKINKPLVFEECCDQALLIKNKIVTMTQQANCPVVCNLNSLSKISSLLQSTINNN